MKYKKILPGIVAFLILLPSLVFASNWLLFTLSKPGETKWFYDKDSITYNKPKVIAGVEIPRKDRTYPNVWIKSAGDRGDMAYQVELNCKGRTARLFDETGKTLYNESSIDYLYDKPIVPDSVLDVLRRAICR